MTYSIRRCRWKPAATRSAFIITLNVTWFINKLPLPLMLLQHPTCHSCWKTNGKTVSPPSNLPAPNVPRLSGPHVLGYLIFVVPFQLANCLLLISSEISKRFPLYIGWGILYTIYHISYIYEQHFSKKRKSFNPEVCVAQCEHVLFHIPHLYMASSSIA